MTSLQFQTNSSYIRRPSADTILVDVCSKEYEKNIVFVTPNRKQTITTTKRKISFAPEDIVSSDDEDEEIVSVSDIHVAVRRDASLFKIEKVPSKDESPVLLEALHPLDEDTLLKENKDNLGVTAGLLTPPQSPQCDINTAEISSEPLILLPHIIHVQKVIKQFCKYAIKSKPFLYSKLVAENTSKLERLIEKILSIKPVYCHKIKFNHFTAIIWFTIQDIKLDKWKCCATTENRYRLT